MGSVGSRAGDLGQQVFVEVPVGIAVGHGNVVEQVDDLRQQGRGRAGEPGFLHVVAKVESSPPAVRRKGNTFSP